MPNDFYFQVTMEFRVELDGDEEEGSQAVSGADVVPYGNDLIGVVVAGRTAELVGSGEPSDVHCVGFGSD